MAPTKSLPLPPGHQDVDFYVEALLHFITTSKMLQTLCGGLHILDFMTSTPDHYESILPTSWREWLKSVDILDFHNLLMRQDIEALVLAGPDSSWHCYSPPPRSLLDYISSIHHLLLDRSFSPASTAKLPGLSRQISVGMKVKKAHEVENFASFVNDLSRDGDDSPISHIVDLGSGQAYLGRVLAGPLYKKQVIAIESKSHNVAGAKNKDMGAKLIERPIILRNKKKYRATGVDNTVETETLRAESHARIYGETSRQDKLSTKGLISKHTIPTEEHGSIQYVEHRIVDGDMENVVKQIKYKNLDAASPTKLNNSQSDVIEEDQDKGLLVISLHSCGNLIHHGLRSLVLNPSVKAVALVGCCYNLCTERLGPPTFKFPALRSFNRRLETSSLSCDPHGFPMSERFATYKHGENEGIRLNITARMMAVQAPQNWTAKECDSFFTRHFWRALLQRIFVDRGFVKPSRQDCIGTENPQGWTGSGEPVVIGSLQKHCYTSFVAYVRGAFARLLEITQRKDALKRCMDDLDDEEIASYEERFRHKKHELCIVWSLMAFSAGVIESAIIVDRWLFLKEQKDVKDAWVQTVFEYKQSPRNLVVVGHK